MKFLYRLVFIMMIFPALSMAQQNQGAFTLDQAIQYGLDHSNTIKNSVLDEQIAKARVNETRGIGLPQISANINIMHNQMLQRFFNSAGVVGAFSGQKIDNVDSTAIVAAKSPFQLKSAGLATLTLNQIIFNGSYLVGLKAANAYKELSLKTTQQTKEDLIAQITKAYYTALVNTERMKLFDTNIERVESLLQTTRSLNANGFAESIDVDRIRVTLNNLKTEREKFANLMVLSLELLKFQMNFPMENDIALLGKLDDIIIPENAGEYEADWDYSTRTDYQVLQASKRLQMLNVKNNYAAGLPSLVAFANYGYSTQSANVSGLFRTETGLSSSFNSNLGPDKWYPYSNIGVTLAVPIFSGLQRTYKVQQAKLALQKIQNGENTLKSGIALEIKQSKAVYENSLKTLVSQKENMQLASNVARVTKIKYEQGVGSNIEVIDAESSLKQSQINYYNALYDALVAKVDLDKAYGKLNPQNQQKK